MELIEAVINLIEKFHNNSPVNNILDLPSLLSLRWKSIGKWLCPNGIKKNKKAEHLHLCHSVQHKAPSSGSAWRRHPRAAQDDSHLPLTLEAVGLDWTPGQTRGCDSRAGTSRAVEKSALMKPRDWSLCLSGAFRWDFAAIFSHDILSLGHRLNL